MIPTYRYSIPSPMPIVLNEDQNPQFFSHHQAYSPSSSLSYPNFYGPVEDQPRSHYWQSNSKSSKSDAEADKPVLSGGSPDFHPTEKVERNMKSTVWKKEERDEENQAEHSGSAKWMSSKMRIMKKMMVSDQTGSSDVAGSSTKNFEDQEQPLSRLGTDNSSNSSSYNSHVTVRVCSNCHTTKTPLWRSGPRGPKSLCNACGIRQRKARRAMAAAAAVASANGTILAAEAAPSAVERLQNKEKKSKINGSSSPLKKKRKMRANKPISQERKKFSFEDFRISLSKKRLQQIFPQDEKEAAILLMALSYGLVHG